MTAVDPKLLAALAGAGRLVPLTDSEIEAYRTGLDDLTAGASELREVLGDKTAAEVLTHQLLDHRNPERIATLLAMALLDRAGAR